MFNKRSIVIAVLALLVAGTQIAAAPRPADKGPKQNSHLVSSKPTQTCHHWSENGWIVEPQYYPIYSDYLEDLNHYFGQYPNTCKVSP